ncbi:unnamed protein product [Nyctereutes procyonoides]|uniref:(raccoon dog) hypothetical protein n=1 Tax=Nyctereutes procyonoides TaxID=34880 RepID=A0A811ZP29_NYCPR|nr:unnamed protein product [Nyctereutes procyonoides]
MNLQLTHTRKMHSISSTTAPMPQGKYVENRFNQSLKKQCEHHSLTYSASVHARKKPRLPPRHLPHSLHYKPKLKIDSSFFGLIGHRTTKHLTTLPPGIQCVTSTSSAAYATQHCSRPLTAPQDTSSQIKTVVSSRIIHLHPPQESKPVPALLWQHGPSCFQLLTSYHSFQNQWFPSNRPRGISKAAN